MKRNGPKTGRAGTRLRWLIAVALSASCVDMDGDPFGEGASWVLSPPADGEFVAFSCGDDPSFDPQGDASGTSDVDIVGDAAFPAMYRYLDTANGVLLLRMRLSADPTASTTDMHPKSWGFLFDNDEDYASYEFLLHANGTSADAVTWEQNDVQAPPNDPGDGTRTVLVTYMPTIDFWHGKPTEDGSNFGGDPDYFFTLAVRLSDLDDAGISLTDAHGIWAVTSNNNTNFSVDLSCDNNSGDLEGQQTDADPLDPACLTDMDDDGVCDVLDPCPFDNPDDSDGDNLCDSDDPCPNDPLNDQDNDGVCAPEDPCPLDPNDDSDGDGICDSDDLCPMGDDDLLDPDEDLVCDPDDNCPNIANQDQSDGDGDGVGDVCDPCPLDNPDDTDGDGTCDSDDTCVGGDDNLDADEDEVCDADDNCPNMGNPDQTDSDGDGVGDACDDCPDDADNDIDGDGICGNMDNCPSASNPGQEDSDEDGRGDACDNCEDPDGDGICSDDDNCPGDPNFDQIDSDGDGLGDVCDACEDADSDGVCIEDDNCPDDANLDQADQDDDGLGDVCDADRDGDGVDDTIGLTGGGGCQAAGSGLGGSAAALLLLAFVGLARRRKSVVVTAAVIGCLFAGQTSARAQATIDRGFTVERFQLAFEKGIMNVEWGKVPEHMVWSLSAWLGAADDPLVTYDVADPDTRLGSLVDTRIGGAITGAMSFLDRVAIAVTVPVVLYQDGDSIDGVAMDGAITTGGAGDVELGGKVALLPPEHPLGLAIIARLTTPTATSEADYLGEGSVTFAPELAISHAFGRVRAAINVGVLLREQTMVGDLEVDDEITARLGLGYAVTPELELAGTLTESTALTEPFEAKNRGVLEGLVGGSYQIASSASLFAGAGAAIDEGFGSPDWRVLLGARLSGAAAEEPEPLAPPIATTEPEPLPPADTDGDGIVDPDDSCPTEAETVNGYEDLDGCPDDPDLDGDGIPASADGCPEEPEDVDNFEDQDGCPELDNDRDGVADTTDGCPDEAGPVENRGCPDSDRDGDTVVDRLDNCPDVPGPPANHGCKRKQLVQITTTKLLVTGTVTFASGKARIQARSNRLLNNVADVLKAHPELQQIQVEGHTDDRGGDDFNLELSQRRAQAVVDYLVKKGVSADRLEAKGFGETQPIGDNSTRGGRAANRRVEFMIVGDIQKTEPVPAPATP